jgi:hypothetical protein
VIDLIIYDPALALCAFLRLHCVPFVVALFPFETLGHHIEPIAIDLYHIFDLLGRQSGLSRFTARVREKLCARLRVDVNAGEKSFES